MPFAHLFLYRLCGGGVALQEHPLFDSPDSLCDLLLRDLRWCRTRFDRVLAAQKADFGVEIRQLGLSSFAMRFSWS